MQSTENVPAKIQAEAKQRALAVLNSEPNCVSMIRPEDLETAALFIPVVTIIKPVQGDFYDPIPKIGIMAKPPLMNTIREKAGVEILRTETSKRGEHIWVAHAYGQKRMPDGTMFPDDAGYEFNADERAEADILGQPDKYRSETSKRLHVLEMAKFGEQRAVTGAQHALICKMAKVARAFKTPEELMRGMKVLRIDRNVNGILQDPGMRQAVIDHALGVTKEIYGPDKQLGSAPVPRTVNVENGEVIQQPPAGDLFEDAEDEKPPAAEPTPEDKARAILESYREKIKGMAEGRATKLLEKMLAKKDATLDELNALIDRFEAALQAKKEGAA